MTGDGGLLISGAFLEQPTTGSGQYLRGLLPHLARQWEGQVTVLRPAYPGGVPVAERRFWGDNVQIEDVTLPIGGNLGKLWFEHVAFPFAARRLGATLAFVPYFGPPLLCPAPLAVTVHDVIMLAVPEYAGSLPARAYSQLAAAAARRADFILTDSEHSRADAIRYAGLAPERIQVVPLAADMPSSAPADPAPLLRERYNLTPGYVLYMGGLDLRKDVATLLRAYALLDGAPPLAIAGQPRSGNTARFPNLPALASELGIADRVRFLGWVPEEDKPALYAGADVFAFTSRYEGFGLTPLEAMAGGAPVVCSNASSLPEVVGDAGLLFPAADHVALAAALRRVLGDAGLRDQLRQAGRNRAARFTWEATADATVIALRSMLLGRSLKTAASS
ncbi:MAG: glycosyltransferase family 1 protein [Chloroflexi bacterium]|nr:glycosyltransferase family 1 protein [Chloroflexota bacterium]